MALLRQVALDCVVAFCARKLVIKRRKTSISVFNLFIIRLEFCRHSKADASNLGDGSDGDALVRSNRSFFVRVNVLCVFLFCFFLLD